MSPPHRATGALGLRTGTGCGTPDRRQLARQPSRLPAAAQPGGEPQSPTRPAPVSAPAAAAGAAPYLRPGEAVSAGAARRCRCSGGLRAAGGAGPAVTCAPASPPAPARRGSSPPAVARLDADLGLPIARHPAGSAGAAGSPRTSISDARQPGRHRRVLVCMDCSVSERSPSPGAPRPRRKVGTPQALSPGGSPARRSGSSGGQRAGGRCGRLGAAGRAAWARSSPRSGSVPPPAAAWVRDAAPHSALRPPSRAGRCAGRGAALPLLLRGGRPLRGGGGCGRAGGGGGDTGSGARGQGSRQSRFALVRDLRLTESLSLGAGRIQRC